MSNGVSANVRSGVPEGSAAPAAPRRIVVVGGGAAGLERDEFTFVRTRRE